jgi:hypothetical protein
MRSYLILGMCSLYLIQYFSELSWLRYLVVAIALIAFVGSAPKADRLPRLLGFFMMGLGMILEIGKGTGVEGISDGLFLILPLLCLITLAPLLSIPLRFGGYFEAVALLLKKLMQQPKKLYAGITGTLFLLSPVLNLGSVRIINEFLDELKLPSMMSAKSYLVGFTTAIFWSPYFASVSLVLHYLHVPFTKYIGYGIVLSCLSLFIGNLLFVHWQKRNPLIMESTESFLLDKQIRNHLIRLVFFVVLLMGSCLLIEWATQWSMIVIVCLISVFVPAVFAIIPRNWEKMRPLLIDYRDRTVPLMNNEMMLFMSAGMLAFAIKGTAFAEGINFVLVQLANESFVIFAVAVIAIVLILTYMGIHQIAVVGALAMQLQPDELGITSISLALLLLLTWAMSTALSPFSGLNLMVSRFAGISGVQVGLRANGIHMSIVAIIGVTIISFVS